MTKEKKVGKIAIGIMVGIGVSIITIIVIVTLLIIYFFVGNPLKVYKDVDDYEKIMNKYTNEVVEKVHTGFFSFPEKIPNSAFSEGKEPVFYFSYKNTWDDPTCEVYLECEYSPQEYKEEIERLKETIYKSENYPDNERKLIYDDSDRFIRPVYIAIDKANHSYEYAMDLGENKIAYIYTSFKLQLSKIKEIPNEYLPTDYEKSLSNVKWGDGFNVYEDSRTEDIITLDYDR